MRALIQRVQKASVDIQDRQIASIEFGLAVFVAIGSQDTLDDARYIVRKITQLRIFPSGNGQFDRSVLEVVGELLVVSQFTLFGDTRRGRRPNFVDAAPSEFAKEQFANVVDLFRATGLEVVTGRFQENMQVSLVNDGPVTIWIDSTLRHQKDG